MKRMKMEKTLNNVLEKIKKDKNNYFYKLLNTLDMKFDFIGDVLHIKIIIENKKVVFYSTTTICDTFLYDDYTDYVEHLLHFFVLDLEKYQTISNLLK